MLEDRGHEQGQETQDVVCKHVGSIVHIHFTFISYVIDNSLNRYDITQRIKETKRKEDVRGDAADLDLEPVCVETWIINKGAQV